MIQDWTNIFVSNLPAAQRKLGIAPVGGLAGRGIVQGPPGTVNVATAAAYTVGSFLYADSASTLAFAAIAGSVAGRGLVESPAGTLNFAQSGAYTVGDLPYASGASAISMLPDVATGNALLAGGIGIAPLWGKVDLTTTVTGVLPVANGGTGLGTWTTNGILYASAPTTLANGSMLTWSGTVLGVDGDLSFIGARQISTTTGNLTIQPAGNTVFAGTSGMVSIATASPITTSSPKLYIAGTIGTVWSDIQTNAATKTVRLGSSHYTNAEEPVALFVAINSIGSNILRLGGGSGALNAMTQLEFYVGATTTITTGSRKWLITSDGILSADGAQTIQAGSTLSIQPAGNTVFAGTSGAVGIGLAPTAVLTLKAGTTSANTAPLKFTSGSLLSSAEAGAVEFLTDKAYLTITTGTARKEIALSEGLTSGRVTFATTNGRLTDSANLTWASPILSIGDAVADNAGLRIWGTSEQLDFIVSELSGTPTLWWEFTGAVVTLDIGINASGSFSSAYQITQVSGNPTQHQWTGIAGTTMTFNSSSDLILSSGGYKSTGPSGGTAGLWKFGIANSSTTVALDTSNWVELDIGGTLYRLGLITITMP